MTQPKKTRPLVTVYIANHNYGAYIRQTIESVLSQTLQDFEILIIDDGSVDNSREIIEAYEAHDRITTIFQHNQGLTVTNNIALRAARGKYVMRLDADDYLDEHALQILSGVLEREPSVAMAFPDYYEVDPNGQVLEVVRRHDFDEVTVRDQPAHGACTMIRRDVLREIGGYDETLRCQDGYDLWVRFISRYEARNVNLPLFYYRQHGASLTRNEEHILTTRAEILRKHAALQANPLSAVAIIPVRGSSIDPSSQALRLLGGKALIDWTIEAALGAKQVKGVIVTTPDEDVLSHVAARFGDAATLDRRDPELAKINSFLESTLNHVIESCSALFEDVDAIAELYIESPFRTAHHIDSALNAMALFETDSVVGVRPETDVFYQHNGHGLTALRTNVGLRLEAEEIYREAGDLRIVRRSFFEANKAILGGRIGHVVLDQRASLGLVSEFNWTIAEFLAMDKDNNCAGSTH